MSATRKAASNAVPPGVPLSPVGASSGDQRLISTHSAFWVMTRRVTILAACVDVAFLVFFLAVDSPLLAWLNVVSIGMYAAAYGLLVRRRNSPALLLIWTEVVAVFTTTCLCSFPPSWSAATGAG